MRKAPVSSTEYVFPNQPAVCRHEHMPGDFFMADEAESKRDLEGLIRRLVRETGINIDQARFLVSILGND